jgi:hypothetical protein
MQQKASNFSSQAGSEEIDIEGQCEERTFRKDFEEDLLPVATSPHITSSIRNGDFQSPHEDNPIIASSIQSEFIR